MAKALIYVLLGTILIGIIGSTSYGVWQISRKWNYRFSYRSMVEDTVREMVKDSSLRAPKGK